MYNHFLHECELLCQFCTFGNSIGRLKKIAQSRTPTIFQTDELILHDTIILHLILTMGKVEHANNFSWTV